MATRNRKSSSTSHIAEKSKKHMKRAQKDINNTSLASSRYASLVGLFVILFGVIYVVIFGNYIYKRKTGHPSALNQANPNIFNIGNLDMDTLRKAIKLDENGKVTFSEEDLEKFKEVFVDVNGNAQVPPKDNGNEEENIEEVGNEEAAADEAAAKENGEPAEAAADAAADAEAANDEKKKKTRMKNSQNTVKNVVYP